MFRPFTFVISTQLNRCRQPIDTFHLQRIKFIDLKTGSCKNIYKFQHMQKSLKFAKIEKISYKEHAFKINLLICANRPYRL